MRKIFFIVFLALLAVGVSFLYHWTQQADINYYKGRRLFFKASYEEAKPYYLKAIELSPGKIDAIRELAYCYLWTAQPQEAIGLLQKASASRPKEYETKLSLAQAYSWQKNYTEAVLLFKEIIKDTDKLEAKIKLTEVYLWSEQFGEAEVILKDILKEAPNNLEVKLLWGKLLYYTGRNSQAAEVFKEIINK